MFLRFLFEKNAYAGDMMKHEIVLSTILKIDKKPTQHKGQKNWILKTHRLGSSEVKHLSFDFFPIGGYLNIQTIHDVFLFYSESITEFSRSDYI